MLDLVAGEMIVKRTPGMCSLVLLSGLLLLGSLAVEAQTGVTAESVPCLPDGENTLGWAVAAEAPPDSTMRLYFRRLNSEAEDYYWVQMYSQGGGRHWGVFPRPETHNVDRDDLTEQRDGAQDDPRPVGDSLLAMSDEEFDEWLDSLENEPVEYYMAMVDPFGAEIVKSDILATVVLSRDECNLEFTPMERGEADNLTVGETAAWQRGQLPFHWECAGIVSRIDLEGVKRGDEGCRSCVPCPTTVGDVIQGYESQTVSPSEF